MKIMKKYLFLAAAIALMVGCADDSVVNSGIETPINGELRPITFGSFTAATTRADHEDADAAALLGSNFVVQGMKSDGTIGATDAPVFDHYNVNWVTNTENTTTSNTDDWEYVAQGLHAHTNVAAQSIKYWDYAKSQYDFIAYSKGSATAVYNNSAYVAGTNVLFTEITPATLTTSAYTVKGRAADLAKVYIADLVTAYRAENDYQDVVKIKFRSLSAKVRLAIYETVPGYSVQGTSVKFYTADGTKDDSGVAHLYTKGTDVFNEEGTYKVYYPTVGYTNSPNGSTPNTDYNKAHLAFTAETSGTATSKDFGALDDINKYVIEEVDENGDKTNANGDKLYLGRSSNTATYAGVNTTASPNYYTIVIPNEAGAVLNLKVDYTLISTDGSGEVINVTGATAQVPAEFATWKSGYAYTYLFKISQNTNGKTNPSVGPEGLYPITFDAVVTETEDGVQETITTVAKPSITTYAKGQIVTTNNEYTTGSTIYAFVEQDGVKKLTVGTNANLYTVTLGTGAAQTINEASVANALAHGTYDSTAKTYTVTDANGVSMVVTENSGLSAAATIPATDAPDGNAITIDGAKFTAGAAGTIYAFEYIAFKGEVPVADTDLAAGGYYTESAGVYTACTTGTANGSTTYYKPDTKHYKIIRIKE